MPIDIENLDLFADIKLISAKRSSEIEFHLIKLLNSELFIEPSPVQASHPVFAV
jgi:hypothetical protein